MFILLEFQEIISITHYSVSLQDEMAQSSPQGFPKRRSNLLIITLIRVGEMNDGYVKSKVQSQQPKIYWIG